MNFRSPINAACQFFMTISLPLSTVEQSSWNGIHNSPVSKSSLFANEKGDFTICLEIESSEHPVSGYSKAELQKFANDFAEYIIAGYKKNGFSDSFIAKRKKEITDAEHLRYEKGSTGKRKLEIFRSGDSISFSVHSGSHLKDVDWIYGCNGRFITYSSSNSRILIKGNPTAEYTDALALSDSLLKNWRSIFEKQSLDSMRPSVDGNKVVWEGVSESTQGTLKWVMKTTDGNLVSVTLREFDRKSSEENESEYSEFKSVGSFLLPHQIRQQFWFAGRLTGTTTLRVLALTESQTGIELEPTNFGFCKVIDQRIDPPVTYDAKGSLPPDHLVLKYGMVPRLLDEHNRMIQKLNE